VRGESVINSALKKLKGSVRGLKGASSESQFAPVLEGDPFSQGKARPETMRPDLTEGNPVVNGSALSAGDPVEFDIASLLRLRSFLYLLAGTVVFLFQINNTLSIINLARENEHLREQILMTSSVITSQELKVHELHSIHNIVQTAESLGLMASVEPAVRLGQ